MISSTEKIKSGIVKDAPIFENLNPGKNREHASTLDLHSWINLEDTIMLKKME